MSDGLFHALKAKLSNVSTREVKRGEIIYREGDNAESVWLVEEGLLGLFHTSETGRETFLRVFGNASILGHRSIMAEENFHASAIALTASILISIPKQEFIALLKSDSELLFKVSAIIAKDLRQAELRMAGIIDKSAPKRIIESILYLRLRHPDQTWTRKEIAEYSASTVETVTRVMTQLEERKLIAKDKRRFDIPDPQMLIDHQDSF